jgi:starch synthase (maltosyl-transferring)
MHNENGRTRIVIEGVTPEIDGGRFPIKRTVGEDVVVEADVFADGHDALACVLRYQKQGDEAWEETTMDFLVNDRWRGAFTVTELGWYLYTIQGWVNHFASWRGNLRKKVEAGQDVSVEWLTGAVLMDEAAGRASGSDAARLEGWAKALRSSGQGLSKPLQIALDEDVARLMARYSERSSRATYDKKLAVVVDREKARFSAWYEMFPRSCSGEPGRHGTFRDCENRLSYVAGMGFDVLYFPPIHPIGRTHRKGKNNAPNAGSEDPGSPWAIGAKEGGHKDVHPQLGRLDDFQRLVKRAAESGVDVAIDLAFHCTPDHPYAKAHPEWFRRRPDGTVQYAENPPKKYEDIYPIDFETDHWQEVWEELKEVVRFWIDQGVRIFRVDNPHTKPFRFWEWLISEIKKEDPQVIFLAEAFTRPKVMYGLAKLGFSQSYTYFAWRNTKWELTEYFTELTQTEVREYFRPSLWTNTPDILTEYLQMGGRPGFVVRLILAATLGASYGIYGPAFELCENRAKEFGSEEYLDSEKYQIRHWDIDRPDSLKDLITRVNRIRRENPALQSDRNLMFHHVDNDQLICFSKQTNDRSNIILVVVNLDPHHTHGGWLEIPMEPLGLEAHQPFQVHDLLGDARFLWHGSRNYVELNPQIIPAHVFRIRHRIRTEKDFDYFM